MPEGPPRKYAVRNRLGSLALEAGLGRLDEETACGAFLDIAAVVAAGDRARLSEWRRVGGESLASGMPPALADLAARFTATSSALSMQRAFDIHFEAIIALRADGHRWSVIARAIGCRVRRVHEMYAKSRARRV